MASPGRNPGRLPPVRAASCREPELVLEVDLGVPYVQVENRVGRIMVAGPDFGMESRDNRGDHGLRLPGC